MTEEQFVIWVGNRIREVRNSVEMSQQEVANKAGCNRAFIAKVENGKKVSTYRLKRIMEAMGLNLQDLFNMIGTPSDTGESCRSSASPAPPCLIRENSTQY